MKVVRRKHPCKDCLRYNQCSLKAKDSPYLTHCDFRISPKQKERVKPLFVDGKPVKCEQCGENQWKLKQKGFVIWRICANCGYEAPWTSTAQSRREPLRKLRIRQTKKSNPKEEGKVKKVENIP